MIRTILIASLLLFALAPVAEAETCVFGVCVPVDQPPHCHVWDPCGPPPCDASCGP